MIKEPTEPTNGWGCLVIIVVAAIVAAALYYFTLPISNDI